MTDPDHETCEDGSLLLGLVLSLEWKGHDASQGVKLEEREHFVIVEDAVAWRGRLRVALEPGLLEILEEVAELEQMVFVAGMEKEIVVFVW